MDGRAARHVLVVGSDSGLSSEIAAAFEGAGGSAPVLHTAATARDGLLVLRDRRVDFALVQMAGSGAELRGFAQAAATLAPEMPVIALHGGAAESSLDLDAAVVIEALRVRVADFLRRPVSGRDLEDVLRRIRGGDTKRPERLGTIAAFASNKGGVGKSTLAVNTACCLARRHPGRVLVVDVSLQIGVCSHMLDIEPAATLADALRERDRLDDVLLRQMASSHPCGVDLLAAPRGAVDGAEVDADGVARVLHLATRVYDYVIVDTFPLLDGVVMSVLDAADLAFVVVQGSVPGVIGAADFLGVLGRIGIATDRQRVVLNEPQPRFSGCLRRHEVEGRLGREARYAVPFCKGVLSALNRGEPYALSAWRWSGFRRAVEAMSRDIESAGRPVPEAVPAPGAPPRETARTVGA